MISYRRDRLVLIVPRDHALAGARCLRLVAVIDEPFVMLHAGSAIHTFTMNAAAALGGHLAVRIQVRSFEAVCRMVAAGVGIGLVPHSAIGSEAVVVIDLDEAWAPRDLQICVRDRGALSGFAAALLADLSGSEQKNGAPTAPHPEA